MKVLDLEWAAASRPARGGEELGDGSLVKRIEGGVLIAVVDGLGHGREAAAATRLALRAIELSTSTSPERVCRECHVILHPSRGAVMGLAYLDTRHGDLSWLSVGSVGGAIYGRQNGLGPAFRNLVAHNGVVGRRLPLLRPVSRRLSPGDLLILTTDGIRPAFAAEEYATDSPEQLASAILGRHGVPDDDALVLVVCFRGDAR